MIFYDADKISYGIKKIKKNNKLLAKDMFSEKIVKTFYRIFSPKSQKKIENYIWIGLPGQSG